MNPMPSETFSIKTKKPRPQRTRPILQNPAVPPLLSGVLLFLPHNRTALKPLTMVFESHKEPHSTSFVDELMTRNSPLF